MIKLVLLTLFGIADYSLAGDVEDIYIKLGDPSYDGIYYKTLPENVEKTWKFTTDLNAKLSFHCREYQISRRAVCRNEEIIVEYGNGREKKLCGGQFDVQLLSTGNTMSVRMKTSTEPGYMDCLVQAISGLEVDQYKNIESTEVDSSEYGVTKGPKGTTCPCGWSTKEFGRIVNGQQTGRHEFPWMAGIRRDGGFQFCGGAIISEYHVLTAAHCTVNKHDIELEVIVGTNIRWAEREGQRIKVEKIIENNYTKSGGHENDISILILKDKINYNENVGPVCLSPENININNQYVTVMGWGNLQQFKSEQPDYLRKAYVRVVDINTCSYKFNRKFSTEVPNRVCTWSSNRDSCMGDSGGPLVWLDPETNRYVQVALVSFGKGCNTPNPKVNTNVAYYYEWILKTVKDTNSAAQVCTKIGKWRL
uniref:Venom S1 protease 15 n=1 Tax=Ectomocoris sp. TaxID=3104572 RepID=A0AB38ZE88_9HEMI